MLRVPHSLNSKCKEAGMNDAEVTIIQRWEGYRPDYRLLLGHFYADLQQIHNNAYGFFEVKTHACYDLL
jgi:hypothetical protein